MLFFFLTVWMYTFVKYTEQNFHLSVSQLVLWCIDSAAWENLFFSHCEGMQREGIPLPKPKNRVPSSLLSASMPKLWMGIIFLNCQQVESRLPTFILCVCSAPAGKWGWNKGQWQSDHTIPIFWGSPPLAKPPQDTGKYCQIHKGAVYLFQPCHASRVFILLQKSSAGWRWGQFSITPPISNSVMSRITELPRLRSYVAASLTPT